jgi:hypothetical protein
MGALLAEMQAGNGAVDSRYLYTKELPKKQDNTFPHAVLGWPGQQKAK